MTEPFDYTEDFETNATLGEDERQNMRSAVVRTSLPQAWSAVILYIAARLGWSVSSEDLIVLAPLMIGLGGIVYRLGRYLELRFPTIGQIILGSKRIPTTYSSAA